MHLDLPLGTRERPGEHWEAIVWGKELNMYAVLKSVLANKSHLNSFLGASLVHPILELYSWLAFLGLSPPSPLYPSCQTLPSPPCPGIQPHGILNSRTADVPAGDIELVQV